LGLLNNATIGQKYYDQLRTTLQALDQLIMGNVINATQASPPSSPANGNAYLLTGGTPSGAWTGQAGNIAVWDTQVTLTGTNTLAPAWVFYTPQPGWVVWNVALAGLYVYTGSEWTLVTTPGGANFPTNTDITSMTGLTNQTLTSSGYAFANGTATSNTVIGAAGWAWGANPVPGNTHVGVFVGSYSPWYNSSPPYDGVGIQVSDGTNTTLIGSNTIQTIGVGCDYVQSINLTATGLTEAGSELRVGNATASTVAPIHSYSTGQTISIGPLGTPGYQTGVLIENGSSTPQNGLGLLGFSPNYGVQTTVGAAGSASSIPGAPKRWIQLTDVDGAIVVMPVWAAS